MSIKHELAAVAEAAAAALLSNRQKRRDSRPTIAYLKSLATKRPDLIELPSSVRPLTAALRAIRPHQWAKNALLLLPALAAHVPFSWSVLTTLLAGFVAFSLAASAIYVVNDLVDLPHDRLHPTKRRRPFAARCGCP